MILYLDTETTGLRPGRICQLSYIMQDQNKTIAKNMFFSVDFVEPSALAVHGLSVSKLKELSGNKEFSDRFIEIEKDISSADLIVAHNTAFDFMFLRSEYERLAKVFTYNESYCSMKGMTPVCKLKRSNGIGYKYPKLSELCSYLGLTEQLIQQTSVKLFGNTSSYHDARFDTTAVYLAVNRGMDLRLNDLTKFL